MRHEIVYWKMARREAEVDEAELTLLREQERRGEIYIEFLDGVRLPLTWDHRGRRWTADTLEQTHVAA